jgi:hypothetical protein
MLEELREWFGQYSSSFYTGDASDDPNYALKEEHTYRVAENSRIIASAAGLDEAGVRLAEAIGICHDVGRFRQYRDYSTFRDADSVNHASLSATVLTEEGLLDPLEDPERKTLVRAVSLHNVYRLPEEMDPAALLHARIVRDADKLDIWRVFIEEAAVPEKLRSSAAPLGFPDTGRCSPEIVAALSERKMLRLDAVSTVDDFRLLQLSWVFDLNFAFSLRLFRERGILSSYSPLLPMDLSVTRAVEALDVWVSERLAEAA